MRYAWYPNFEDREVVYFPNGEIGRHALEELLFDNLNSPLGLKVSCLKRVRVSGGEFPEYEEVIIERTVRALRKLYERETGSPFDPEDKSINHSVPCIIFNPITREFYLLDIGG